MSESDSVSPRPASGAPARRRLLVVVNPHATTVSPQLRDLVLHALEARYTVAVADTHYPGHATEIARAATADGHDAVVAFGGDGTLNEVANGLAGSALPMTPLPGGNANVYCRMLGLPGDVIGATEHLLALCERWPLRRVDLGRLGQRRFLFAAGAGLDASVVQRVDAHPRLKAHFRDAYYASVAIATFLHRYAFQPPLIDVLDGELILRGFSVMAQNTPQYTFLGRREIELVAGSTLTSGDISAVLLQTHNPLQAPPIIRRVLSASLQAADHRRIAALRNVTALELRSADGRPLPLQVDGDFIGVAVDVELAVDPAALLVLA